MKQLRALNKYFWKYRWRFFLGIIFIVLSNYFKILSPQVTGYVVNTVEQELKDSIRRASPKTITPVQEPTSRLKKDTSKYDVLVKEFINRVEQPDKFSFGKKILFCGIVLMASALLSGFFMFLMRQTIIVMSRHIEYDQKNEVYQHYQQLDTHFYKTHSTGDLMSRMAEDVSRVRMYTGPAIMYLINLLALIGFSLFYMFQKDVKLTLFVLAPLPVLAITIYIVNSIIHRKSENIQAQLSDLTTNAQESYSGIRVIKSFVQEKAMIGFFAHNSDKYRDSAVNLAKVEAIYFPSIAFLIGLSTLLTIMIGGIYQINHKISAGTIAEFVVYINLLSFPFSAIGWVASMIQRASASQKRLNEFLHTVPAIRNMPAPICPTLMGDIEFRDINFTYGHTGIKALSNFNLKIRKGEKVAIIGRTGSGKSTVAQLLLRMYDPDSGEVFIDGHNIKSFDLRHFREQIGYVPQDVFLFSDTVSNNIRFGLQNGLEEQVEEAARHASVDKEIQQFSAQYQTVIGERGVTLSGGQKQRLSIARALIKQSSIIILDDCLSAVDSKTEKMILANLYDSLQGKTSIIITHRIFSLFDFDKVVVLDDGVIVEEGRHSELLALNGYYTDLYHWQQEGESRDNGTD